MPLPGPGEALRARCRQADPAETRNSCYIVVSIITSNLVSTHNCRQPSISIINVQ